MPKLTPAELIGYASAALLLLTVVGEVARQWTDSAAENVSAWALGGGFLATVGMTLKNVLEHDVLFATLSGALSVYALGVFIVAVTRSRVESVSRRPKMPQLGRPTRVFSVPVHSGKTLGTSTHFSHTSLDMMRRGGR